MIKLITTLTTNQIWMGKKNKIIRMPKSRVSISCSALARVCEEQHLGDDDAHDSEAQILNLSAKSAMERQTKRNHVVLKNTCHQRLIPCHNL